MDIPELLNQHGSASHHKRYVPTLYAKRSVNSVTTSKFPMTVAELDGAVAMLSLRTSSSGGGSSNDRVSDDTADGQSPRKRPKLVHRDSEQSNVASASGQGKPLQRLRAETNKYSYTPLFFHRDSTEEEDDFSSEDEDSMSSPQPVPVDGDSSGMTSSGIRANSGLPAPLTTKKPKHDDGPIIFYKQRSLLHGSERRPKTYWQLHRAHVCRCK